MIIIIRALSPKIRKKERPKKAKRKKKKGPKKKEKEKKKINKRGAMLLSLFHTCASKQHHVLHIASLICCHFHILVGIFHYRTWLIHSNDGLPQNALGLREQASWMHTHLVFLLSFHIFIALVHPLRGNPYSLTLISINGHFHSPDTPS